MGIRNERYLYILETAIQDVCKIGIGNKNRLKTTEQYAEIPLPHISLKQLAVFKFYDVIMIENLLKKTLIKLKNTELYNINFDDACVLLILMGGDCCNMELSIKNVQYNNKDSIKSYKASDIPNAKLLEHYAKDLISKKRVNDFLEYTEKNKYKIPKFIATNDHNILINIKSTKKYGDDFYHTNFSRTDSFKIIRVIKQFYIDKNYDHPVISLKNKCNGLEKSCA